MSEKLPVLIGKNLRAHRALLMQETRIHDAIEAAMRSAGLVFEREYKLSATERLDFWLPESRVAVEVKKGHAGLAELSQLGRYLAHEQVAFVLVIAMRIADLPPTFQGKPIEQLALWRYLL